MDLEIVTSPYEGDTGKLLAFCKEENIPFTTQNVMLFPDIGMEGVVFRFSNEFDYALANDFFENRI